jgi:hypothetical protein
MKKSIKTTAALFAATTILGGVVAVCQQATTIQKLPANAPSPGTKVIPTPDYYTNNQATVAVIQQTRIQQEGIQTKGATALQHSVRIETRPPTAYMRADPWVQQDHPWDINPDLPSIDSSGDQH